MAQKKTSPKKSAGKKAGASKNASQKALKSKKPAPIRQAKPAAKAKAAPKKELKKLGKATKAVAAKAPPAPPAKVGKAAAATKAPAAGKGPVVTKAPPTPKALSGKSAGVKAAIELAKEIMGKKAKVTGGKKAKEQAEEAIEAGTEAEVILTNADGKRYCKVGECDELATSDSYCRYHYLLNWKKIQLRKKILAGDKLNRYIEELTARYPDKYLEMIRKDLATDKDFLTALQELEIDEGSEEGEFEDDSKTYIDEVRGTIPGQDEEDY